ncbi:hypothetical protein BC830DRAFT_1234515 [Chytriomyces sp. MP71]|nr:hypothetical protein BC830DRAFT_1234515 [Chytriomyces sp. MP71]
MNPLGLQLGSHLPHPLNRAMWIPPSHPSHETVAYFKKSHATAAAHAGISLRAVEAQQRLFTLAFLWGLEGETDKEVGVHPQVLFLSTGVHFAIADMGLDENTRISCEITLKIPTYPLPYPVTPAMALLLVWLLYLQAYCDAFLNLPRSALASSCAPPCVSTRTSSPWPAAP